MEMGAGRLLIAQDQACEMSQAARSAWCRAEVRWFVSLWLPLAGAKPVEDRELLIRIKEVFVSLAELLEAGRTVFVHCSAGIHRTGMITNGFLRFLGHDASEAADLLNRTSVSFMELPMPVDYKFADRAESQLETFRSMLDEELALLDPPQSFFDGFAGLFEDMGMATVALGRKDEASSEFLNELWFRRARFLVGSLSEGESSTLFVPGAAAPMTFEPVLRAVKCSTWVHAVALASTFNDADTLKAALGFDKLTSKNETYSTLEEPRAAVFRALFGGAEDVDEVLQAALLSTDPTGMYSGLAEYAMVWLLPEYRLIEAILGGDQTEFDNAVVAVHEAHVQWYSAVSEHGEPRYGNIDVLVNWELSGLVALALRRGFSAPPQSPYMFTAAPTPEGVEQ